MVESFERFCIDGFTIPRYIERFIFSALMKHIGKTGNADNITNLSDRDKQVICKGIDLISKNNKFDYTNKEIFYLLYYFTFNMFKIWIPLKDLSHRNALNRDLLVLDVGSGPGTSTIGLIEYYKCLANENCDKTYSITIDIVERNINFISIFRNLVTESKKNLPNNFTVNIRNCFNKDMCDILNNLQSDYDLIYASNIFNSNEPRGVEILKDCIISLKNCLKQRGTLILIEPAEQRITKNFKNICNKIDEEHILNVYSPCNGIYEKCCRCELFSPTNIKINSKIIDFLIEIGKPVKSQRHYFDYYVFRKDGLIKYNFSEKLMFQHIGEIDWKKLGEKINIEAVITSVIIKDDSIIIRMCDGSNIEGPVDLNLNNDQMSKMGLCIQLLKGEKIKLEKVEILKRNMLYFGKDSSMEVIS